MRFAKRILKDSFYVECKLDIICKIAKNGATISWASSGTSDSGAFARHGDTIPDGSVLQFNNYTGVDVRTVDLRSIRFHFGKHGGFSHVEILGSEYVSTPIPTQQGYIHYQHGAANQISIDDVAGAVDSSYGKFAFIKVVEVVLRNAGLSWVVDAGVTGEDAHVLMLGAAKFRVFRSIPVAMWTGFPRVKVECGEGLRNNSANNNAYLEYGQEFAFVSDGASIQPGESAEMVLEKTKSFSEYLSDYDLPPSIVRSMWDYIVNQEESAEVSTQVSTHSANHIVLNGAILTNNTWRRPPNTYKRLIRCRQVFSRGDGELMPQLKKLPVEWQKDLILGHLTHAGIDVVDVALAATFFRTRERIQRFLADIHGNESSYLMRDTYRMLEVFGAEDEIPRSIGVDYGRSPERKQQIDDKREIIKKAGLSFIKLPRSTKSLKAIHDYVSAENQRLEEVLHEQQVIEYGPLQSFVDALDGWQTYVPEVGQLTWRAAKNSLDILRWGNEMKHCISSYTQRALDLQVILGGVFSSSGKLLYNFEAQVTAYVDNGGPWKSHKFTPEDLAAAGFQISFGQIRGYKNEDPPDSVIKIARANLDLICPPDGKITTSRALNAQVYHVDGLVLRP